VRIANEQELQNAYRPIH